MKDFLSYIQNRRVLVNSSCGIADEKGLSRVYLGFDPTAEALHIGHLAGILFLKRLASFGHHPVALIGGATGLVGDPSGKSSERVLLDGKTVAFNVSKILLELKRYIPEAEIVNNYDWLGEMSLIDFLRDVAKFFRVGPMLAKDSVKQRMASEEGISFTEFSYQLLQAYDFYRLSEDKQIFLQVGGSDQWGNITAGIDFIRKVSGKKAHGFTYPLLTDSNGKKIGKSEGKPIWLDADRTSPYVLYQYIYGLEDRDMPLVSRLLTLLDNEEVTALDRRLSTHPEEVKDIVASEVVRIVHGDQGVFEAKNVTQAMSPGKNLDLTQESFDILIANGFGRVISKDIFSKKWVDLLVESGLCSSKGEVRRLVGQRGIYLNSKILENSDALVSQEDLLEGRYILLAKGRKNKFVFLVQ